MIYDFGNFDVCRCMVDALSLGCALRVGPGHGVSGRERAHTVNYVASSSPRSTQMLGAGVFQDFLLHVKKIKFSELQSSKRCNYHPLQDRYLCAKSEVYMHWFHP